MPNQPILTQTRSKIHFKYMIVTLKHSKKRIKGRTINYSTLQCENCKKERVILYSSYLTRKKEHICYKCNSKIFIYKGWEANKLTIEDYIDFGKKLNLIFCQSHEPKRTEELCLWQCKICLNKFKQSRSNLLKNPSDCAYHIIMAKHINKSVNHKYNYQQKKIADFNQKMYKLARPEKEQYTQ